MAVEYESIIQKMMIELHQAKEAQNNYAKMKHHIAKVQVLSELVLEERSTIGSTDHITDQEIKAMVGKKEKKINHDQLSKPLLSTDQENEGSIFDF